MPPKQDFPHIFFRRDAGNATCIVETTDAEGVTKKCGHTIPANSGNQTAHLSAKHKIVKDGPEHKTAADNIRAAVAAVNGAKKQQRLSETVFTPGEWQAVAFAEAYRPFTDTLLPVSRRVYNFTVLDPETLKEATRSAAQKALALELRRHAGKRATLLIDNGTVWNTYCVVGLQIAGAKEPLLAAIRPTAELGGAGALNMAQLMGETIKLVAAAGVVPIAVASDNAAANLAMMPLLPGLIHQRCLAHCLNLALQDFFAGSPRATEIFDIVYALRGQRNGIPRWVPTRWNTRLLVLTAARSIVAAIPGVNAGELNLLINLLDAFKSITNLVQRNGATAIDGINAVLQFQALKNTPAPFSGAMQAVVDARLKNNFLVEHALLVAFFSPVTRQSETDIRIITIVRDMLRSQLWNKVALLAGAGKETKPLADDFHVYQINPFPRREEVTRDEYIELWRTHLAAKAPRLTALVAELVNITPTEAAVERFFSRMKRLVPPNRASLKHPLVFAQLELNLLVKSDSRVSCFTDAPHAEVDVDDGAAEGEVEIVGSDDDEPEAAPRREGARASRALTRVAAHAYLELWAEANKRPRVHDAGDGTCGSCEKPLAEHDGGSTLCTSCHRYCAYSCEGLAASVADRLGAEEVYVCQKCKTMYD